MSKSSNTSAQKASISSLSHEGRGIAFINNKTTFIEGALPGEEVLFIYSKKHSKFDEGLAIEIVSPASHRVEPSCPHFSNCGGCNLQHVDPTQQLLFKQTVLLEQLQHFGHCQPEVILDPLTGPLWGYRHKARLSVKYIEKNDALIVGFHDKNGRFVADLSCCPVLHPKAAQLIEPLKMLIRQLSIYRDIPYIEIAVAENYSALILRHQVTMPDKDKSLLIQFAQQYDFHMYLQANPPLPLFCIWPEKNQELLSYTLPEYDITLKFKPSDFTQINPVINEKMVNTAIQLLELNSDDVVVDLFCGLGNFTLPIAKFCKSVVGIEGDADLVQRAEQNALLNHIKNAQFYMANLADQNLSADWIKHKYNKILLDPPRTGALEIIIKHFPRWRAQNIIYVSCNPATFARDAGELRKLGYRLVKAGVMDMFPHTKHVESIGLFVPVK